MKVISFWFAKISPFGFPRCNFSPQDSAESKKREVEEEVRKEEEKEEKMRIKKKNREQAYHMCFDCRKGILIVE